MVHCVGSAQHAAEWCAEQARGLSAGAIGFVSPGSSGTEISLQSSQSQLQEFLAAVAGCGWSLQLLRPLRQRMRVCERIQPAQPVVGVAL